MSKIEPLKRIILTLLYGLIFLSIIEIPESKSGGCPQGMVKVPNSSICIEKADPARVANFKDISMHCLTRNLDICLAEQIVKACQEEVIKVPSEQGSIIFLTSSGMFVRIMADCNISKTGPIGSGEKEQFLCCSRVTDNL